MSTEPEWVSTGALPDTRPPKEKQKDYDAREIASSHHAVPFRHKKITQLTATLYSQEYTSSCVPHAFYTQLEYEKIVKPKPKGCSQLMSYRKRSNFPGEGSIAVDMYERIKEGQSKHEVAPVKPRHREAEANQLPYIVGEKLIPEFLFFGVTNYQTIPSLISSGKAVAIFILATTAEWSKEYVRVITPNLTYAQAEVSHAVCLIPLGDFTENGEEWLSVHDSAGFGGRHLRYINKDFLLKRCFYASEVFLKTNLPNPEPPVTELPLQPCQFDQTSRAVRNLQGYLIKQGYLESQYQTGYYGNLTAKAVLEWQLVNYQKFNFVRPVRELLSLEGKHFGQQSIDVVKSENE